MDEDSEYMVCIQRDRAKDPNTSPWVFCFRQEQAWQNLAATRGGLSRYALSKFYPACLSPPNLVPFVTAGLMHPDCPSGSRLFSCAPFRSAHALPGCCASWVFEHTRACHAPWHNM